MWRNVLLVKESAADGCLATTNASGAQPPERIGKKEKAARLAFSTRFRRDMWTAPNGADPAENQTPSYSAEVELEGNEVNPWPYSCSIMQC